MKGKSVILLVVLLVIVFVVVYMGVELTKNIGKSEIEITLEDANSRLNKLMNKVRVINAEPVKGKIDLDPVDLASSLPTIDKQPIMVERTTPTYVEVFSSPEKAGSGVDGWLVEVTEAFNQAGIRVNDKPVSVRLRNVSSGIAKDYIISGVYAPDGFTPSNELWGEMIKSAGIKVDLITPRLVGNVPGVVISSKKYDELITEYGSVNAKVLTEAITENKLSFGYTDPFASSTGLNFLLMALHTFDSDNLLSDTAIEGFEKFQANVPFVASITMQMREAASSGVLDAFVLEYQTYVNEPDLRAGYKFIPFGVRHDSPLYAIGNISEERRAILKAYADFILEQQWQDRGKEFGFNNLEDYRSEMPVMDGAVITAAQKLWKEKKNAGRPISAVFVVDVSGSMAGDPLNRVKQSLLTGQKYLGRENRIGLISYSSHVTVNVPIGTYDTNQQSLFVGAVESLQDGGGTATFDAILVAIKMLQDDLQQFPNNRPVIFVLSDGETTEGLSLRDIRQLIEAYKIPIYTIGYNANIEALKQISSINEAASINADTDDVVYKISNLLNVQM